MPSWCLQSEHIRKIGLLGRAARRARGCTHTEGRVVRSFSDIPPDALINRCHKCKRLTWSKLLAPVSKKPWSPRDAFE